MSINNESDYTSASSNVFADYKFGDSSFANPEGTNFDFTKFRALAATDADNIYTRAYYIPLDSVRLSVNYTEDSLTQTLFTIEDNLLRKIYIDPYSSIELEQAHFRIWEELSKLIFNKLDTTLVESVEDSSFFASVDTAEEDVDPSIPIDQYNTDLSEKTDDVIPLTVDQIGKNTPPSYICFDEFLFAEKLSSTASRKLILEYLSVISQSTFSYFYQFRKLLKLFLHEVSCIKHSLLTDFGDEYENESQQEIAIHYDTWAKMVLHYTGRITKTIGAKVEKLPSTELDKISKKQAAQFQAFFAVKLNAIDTEINDILENLKRDLVDNCEIFYSRYVSPSLTMTRSISDPLELDFVSTTFVKDFPNLAGELIVATNAMKGNFISIHADIIERMDLMTARVDALFGLIHEKRKYANYISQLSSVSIQKKQVLSNVDADLFSPFFRSAVVDSSKNNSSRASHNDLDDLDQDGHPQYLMKSGGKITGDISVENGVKIDNVDISDHKHNGIDGSVKISILDIDFSSSVSESEILVIKPISISIEGFIPDILNGGIPVYDAIASIEVPDGIGSNYDYELVYTELED